MQKSQTTVSLCLVLFMTLLGCNGSGSNGNPTASSTPALTQTPTVTPLPNRVVFVSFPDADPLLADQIHAELVALSAQEGLTVEQKNDLQPGNLSSDIKLVVFATNPTNLSEWIHPAGNIQFVVVSDLEITPSSNLTVIRLHLEYSLFIAGYIAEMLSTDWRAAGLIPSDIPQSILYQQAFQNGGRYWCGVCHLEYPPFVSFPLVASLPSSSNGSEWKVAIDQLETSLIYTMVAWDLMDSPEVLQYIVGLNVLTQQGIPVHPILLGNQMPLDAFRASWAVTVLPDVASPLQAAWESLMAGQGDQTYPAGVKMTEINESLFGIGKQRLVNETIQKLVEGLIDPLNP
jgi:hypothetical protein